MKARSLSVFRTKLRRDASGTELVTFGQIIEADEDHLRALARNGLVEIVGDAEETPDAEPDTPPAAAEPAESTEPDAEPEPEPAETTETAKGKKAK